LSTIYARNLQWLITLMQVPGWRDYAQDKAGKMDKGASGLFKGISADLEKHCLSGTPTKTKPPYRNTK
jgi:hypothetical protein